MQKSLLKAIKYTKGSWPLACNNFLTSCPNGLLWIFGHVATFSCFCVLNLCWYPMCIAVMRFLATHPLFGYLVVLFIVNNVLILKVIDGLTLVCFTFRSICMKIIRNSEKARVSSYSAVKILYKGIFGHVTTFWVFTHVKILLIVTAASILITNQHLLLHL